MVTSAHMSKLIALQPGKDAPINRIGRGNTGYLFDATKKCFDYQGGYQANLNFILPA